MNDLDGKRLQLEKQVIILQHEAAERPVSAAACVAHRSACAAIIRVRRSHGLRSCSPSNQVKKLQDKLLALQTDLGAR